MQKFKFSGASITCVAASIPDKAYEQMCGLLKSCFSPPAAHWSSLTVAPCELVLIPHSAPAPWKSDLANTSLPNIGVTHPQGDSRSEKS